MVYHMLPATATAVEQLAFKHAESWRRPRRRKRSSSLFLTYQDFKEFSEDKRWSCQKVCIYASKVALLIFLY